MRTGISFDVTAEDRARLEAIVVDRNRPQKHVWRARIILLSHDGLGTVEIIGRILQSQDLRLALARAFHAGRR